METTYRVGQLRHSTDACFTGRPRSALQARARHLNVMPHNQSRTTFDAHRGPGTPPNALALLLRVVLQCWNDALSLNQFG